MTRSGIVFGTCMVVAMAAGCIPEKRIAWSPDGQRAAVMSEAGIYLIDGEGRLLTPRLTAPGARCEWFPDGSRLLVKRPVKAHTWEDVAPLFNDQETARIVAEAGELRVRILAYSGDWDRFKFEPADSLSPGTIVATFLYLRDRLPEGLAEKLGEKWEDAQKLETDIWHLQVFSLTPTALQPEPVLLRTLEPLSGISVSPSGKAVAYLAPKSTEDPTLALFAAPVNGGSPRLIASAVGSRYDWSPDGRSIAYIRCMSQRQEGEDNVQLGTLTTATVADPSGELLDERPEPIDRVGLLFNSLLHIRWTGDGRLFFTSVEMSLPATTRDMPEQWTLFALDLRMPASVIRVLGRDFSEPLNTSWPMFLPSPDGKRVLLPGPEGAWTLYEIETGQTTVVVAAGKKNEHQYSLPTWRNDSEICLVSPVVVEGSSEVRRRVVLWREGSTRSLSDAWPEEVLAGWSTDNK